MNAASVAASPCASISTVPSEQLRTHPLMPWLVQLFGAIFSALGCLVFIRLTWDSRTVAGYQVGSELAVSQPVMGVYIALFAGFAAVAGAVLGLRGHGS